MPDLPISVTMSGVEGSSIPPPGWKEGHTGASYASAALTALPGIAQPAVAGSAVQAGITQPVVTGIAQPVVATASAQPLVASGQSAAEAAIRWRMRAATLDNLLVYALYLVLCLVFGWHALTVGPLVVGLLLGVVYHFALESNGGQTIGKRRYGIKVVSVHGGPASAKGIALRSLLRFVDALPFSYLSGLISMVRTGPERRQRIGDVAGETKVIAVEGRAATRGTPGWLLPTATLVALVISCLGVFGIVESGRQPLSSSQESAFISTCENSSAGQLLNCQCFLGRLEADGYNTAASLQSLVQDAQNEQFNGQAGAARGELTAAVFACHK